MRKAVVLALTLVVLAALVFGSAWLWMRRPWRVVATVNGVSLAARGLDLRAEAYGCDRRETARAWIAKEILLGEAVQRNVSLAEEDERGVKSVLAAWFVSQGTTVDRFFAEGPLPEDAMRQDLKEGLLIHALVKDGLSKASFPDFYHSLREKALVECPEFPELESLDTGAPLYVGLWGWYPARVSVAAAGQVVTSAELSLRVRNAQDDLKRRGLPLPSLTVLRRHEAQVWIFKAVMLAEAIRQGMTVTPDDERKERAKMSGTLKPHKLTVEQFFKEGVLPESLKVEDFRANIRVNKLLAREVDGRDNVSGAEIEARMAELRRRAEGEAARGLKPTTRYDRKSAINDLRMERHNKGCRAIFRSLYGSARVWAPEFPEMERLDGVSPPLPNGKEALK